MQKAEVKKREREKGSLFVVNVIKLFWWVDIFISLAETIRVQNDFKFNWQFVSYFCFKNHCIFV